jgi:hypothetical protein
LRGENRIIGATPAKVRLAKVRCASLGGSKLHLRAVTADEEAVTARDGNTVRNQ